MSAIHQTVLCQEAIDALVTDPQGLYVDGTFGRGGHTAALLDRVNEGARVIAMDKDREAIAHGERAFATEPRLQLVQDGFARMAQHVGQHRGDMAGILVDLGVSSPQLDRAERGFSFTRDGPLDMRMDQGAGQTAAQWLAEHTAEHMAQVFADYGEERFAKRIARAIVAARQRQSLETTTQLAEIVAAAHPAWERHKHPATRVFQAIRIAINDELYELEQLLAQSLDLLQVGGRLVVISFHSLEDRRVKRFIRQQARGDHLPAKLPVTEDQLQRRLKPLGGAVKPSANEVAANPRARSAVMRAAEKIA